MPVEYVELNLDTILHLDGTLGKLFRKHMRQVTEDCMNRPEDKAKRKVFLEFTVTPVYDPETRECDHVDMEIESKCKVPVFRSKKFQMRATKAGLQFNVGNPDDLDQADLFPDVRDQ